jgi:hypothetical protein
MEVVDGLCDTLLSLFHLLRKTIDIQRNKDRYDSKSLERVKQRKRLIQQQIAKLSETLYEYHQFDYRYAERICEFFKMKFTAFRYSDFQ